MLVNSSLALLPPLSHPSSESLYLILQKCMKFSSVSFVVTAYTITCTLIILPLSVLVLYLGLQQRRQQRSSRTMSHSDFFTYNIIIIELLNVLGLILTSVGVHTDLQPISFMGIYLFALNTCGQLSFHMLISVERYLAVVHPIIYLSLRNAKGIRMRNMATGCTWLVCLLVTCFIYAQSKQLIVALYIFLMLSILTVVSVCSFSVLRVLISPGPGEVVGGRQQLGQSKVRAFYTITAILGVLLFRLMGNLFTTFLYALPQLRESQRCEMLLFIIWFCLPTSLVVPLLFLQRAGVLPCCKSSS